MLDRAKYIIFSRTRFVMFDPLFKHSDVATLLNIASNNIVSAGFVQVNQQGSLVCFGESISLDKESKVEDSLILKEWLRM